MNWIVNSALAPIPLARETVAEYGARHAPPRLELRPYTRWELRERFRGGEREADERDLGMCTVPGCSHAATDSHHVVYRSRGGDLIDPANQTAGCEFHHHRCIHAGWLRVYGHAPEGLVWMRGGEVFAGGGGVIPGRGH